MHDFSEMETSITWKEAPPEVRNAFRESVEKVYSGRHERKISVVDFLWFCQGFASGYLKVIQDSRPL